MTAALTADQRTVLERFVQKTRRSIEDDLASTLEGKFGIHLDGSFEDAAALTLSNTTSATRLELVEIIDYLRTEGESASGSVERLLREAAFTHTNRLIAVRIAEAIGLLPETMAKGVASSGFRDFSELAPTVATTDWGRYAVFLRICADELAGDIPSLFDPRNPLLDLAMSEAVLAQVVDQVQAIPREVWVAPDALGWAYQFFNTGDERKEMRDASAAPRNSRELAVRNQFFTPSYVVEFLVQNGLGAHLASGFPELVDELALLVDVPTERVEIDLRNVSVLDPACGSGHFLLGAYDVLERAWRLAGVDPENSAPDIVRSLCGVDIDARATQIAQAAVMFRARRHRKVGRLPIANVVCARALPHGPQIDELVAALPSHVARAVRGVAQELIQAPVLGPLLKVEERLGRELRDIFGTGVVEGSLAEAAVDDGPVRSAVLAALSNIADSTISSAAQRLFVAEAQDAVRFVDAMSRRYTTVLMNPPFGEPIPTCKSYVKSRYPKVPRGAYLEAAFIDRATELLASGGSVGVVTSRAPLFLSSFTDWRVHRLMGGELSVLLDVGHGLMEQALVEACALVLTAGDPRDEAEVISLLRSQSRPADLERVLAGADCPADRFHVSTARLGALPASPMCYWATNEQLDIWGSWAPLEPQMCEVRVGSWPGDDFRHLRLWWEVDPSRSHPKEWVPYAKGGPYAPYFEEPHLVVDWDPNRGTFWDFHGRKGRPTSIPENRDYYRRPGLTWSRRTASALSVRVLPEGSIFADKGPGIFCPRDDSEELVVVLAWLNSRGCRALLDLLLAAGEETSSGSASRSYEVGSLRTLPAPPLDDERRVEIVRCCVRLIRILEAARESVETSTLYRGPDSLPAAHLFSEVVERQYAAYLRRVQVAYSEVEGIERSFGALLDGSTDWIDQACGEPVWEYSNDNLLLREVHEQFSLSEDELVDRALGALPARRFLAVKSHHVDRRVELLCHLQRASPSEIVAALLAREPVRWFTRVVAFRLVSMLVGTGFGRWTQERSAPERENVFAPIERPVETGHSFVLDNDALSRCCENEAAKLGYGPEVLADALQALNRTTDLPMYLGSRFFDEHMPMYSMSRRKAPIYWQLQVPSNAWSVWLYAPRLSREMLFAVVREAEQRHRLAVDQIAHLQREAASGGGGRSASTVAKELEAEQRLAVELASFREEAERIANLGWEPDLDDGLVLNAAPLADLFPAWKDAAAYRKDLRQGKYEWATVARFADRL